MRTAFVLLAAAALALPGVAQAQKKQPARPGPSQTTEAQLRRRVVQLEDRVVRLEHEVARLQAELRAPQGARETTLVDSVFPADGWRDRERWRRLRLGLDEMEVRYLLGEPGRVAVAGFSTVWYYPTGGRGGRVEFGVEGRDVRGWAEP